MNAFKDKETFKSHFADRLLKRYVTTPEEASERQAYQVLAELLSEALNVQWRKNVEKAEKAPQKEVYYFSMEFLTGRLITTNLANMGLRELVRDAFRDFDLDLTRIEREEVDPGLGNGGLGRLAACFLDSIASLSYKGHGNGIRYRFGFFEQAIEEGYQVEKPEDWLKDHFAYEIRRDEEALDIPFGGAVHHEEGDIHYEPQETIRAVPYDIPVPGEKNGVVNTLRLWNAEPSDTVPQGVDPMAYSEEIRNISAFLYPDDTTTEGKILRLKQQYFFTAAGVRSIVQRHVKRHGTLANLPDHVVIQINDTHPSLVIPELVRTLVDDHALSWDKAWAITTKVSAYTNHTILAEALERWPVALLSPTLPRIHQIVEEINRRYCKYLLDEKGYDNETVRRLAIIADGEVRMAHLAIVGSFSVNGVAKLHTEILKKHEMKEFYALYPDKFNAKTNGVTHRRFLKHINPRLSALLDKHVPTWDKEPMKLQDLLAHKDEKTVHEELAAIKRENKVRLSERIKREQGIALDPDSIFDVQIKRLHEYKRQLMNALHILMVYNRLKTDVAFKKAYVPHSFIFGAKAAGAYHYAKKIIKLLNSIARVVNADKDTNDLLQVVFVENYNVTYAEDIIPAADISEQISTASKEASGTGNMKFMMNGALTLGTLDGANVEIAELVGDEHIEIFGMDADEVTRHYEKNDYDPMSVYENDKEIKNAVDMLTSGFFPGVDRSEFQEIRDKLLGEDRYFVLKDLRSYAAAHQTMNERYKDINAWQRSAVVNIAKSGYFSSDRTIEDYVRDIWKLRRFTLDD